MNLLKKTLAAAAALLATTAFAEVNVGVTLSLTGPASGLGIPVGNQFKLFPKEIAGQKINLIVLDDASDPGKGVTNARRFVTDDKVDILFGGSITVVSAAVAPIALDNKTPQLSIAPVGVPPALLARQGVAWVLPQATVHWQRVAAGADLAAVTP